MLLWHGHQWGQGASCAGRRLQRNAARLSRQQGGDHRALAWQGPGGSRATGVERGPLRASHVAHVITQMPFCAPTPPQAGCCPIFGHSDSTLIPAVRPPLPAHCAYTAASPAGAVAPGNAIFLMSGQGLWGLLRVTRFWVPREEMEQR